MLCKTEPLSPFRWTKIYDISNFFQLRRQGSLMEPYLLNKGYTRVIQALNHEFAGKHALLCSGIVFQKESTFENTPHFVSTIWSHGVISNVPVSILPFKYRYSMMICNPNFSILAISVEIHYFKLDCVYLIWLFDVKLYPDILNKLTFVAMVTKQVCIIIKLFYSS